MANNSPWIHQLDKERKIVKLNQDIETDVTIVGGGIAGISTAFFILENTTKNVVLLEGGQLGHGATGHNAGQIVSYFEKPFHVMVKEFGGELAAQAQKDIEGAWTLLDTMYTKCGLTIPLSRFIGHAGLPSKDYVLTHLENNRCRKELGLEPLELSVVEDADFLPEIEEKYAGLYHTIKHEEIIERLETKRHEFIAVLSEQKGVMNSALFTQEIANHLLKTYPERFQIYEHTHVGKVALHDGAAVLDAWDHSIEAGRVVLCTNGFENISIFNKSGLDINTRFHHDVNGLIGFMSGYLEKLNKPPIVLSYSVDPDPVKNEKYFYVTRRPYEYDGKTDFNLISVGGPERVLDDKSEYEREEEYPDSARDEIDAFVKSTYEEDPNKKIEYIFTWHGLMGYTPTLIRLIGTEPKNPVLLYNLGCNGVGILPSIYGGERISRIIAGEKLPQSIFDPRDHQ